ncbi:MAG: hypothetical protein ACPGEC_05730 [Flavobacteriales bacterium]
MTKNIRLLLGILTAVISFIGVYFFVSLLQENLDVVGSAISYTKFLLYAIVALIVVFSLIGVASNPKALKGLAIAAVATALVYFISNGSASDEVLKSYEAYEITPETSKNVGMGLIAFYWTLAITAVVAIAGEVVNAIR